LQAHGVLPTLRTVLPLHSPTPRAISLAGGLIMADSGPVRSGLNVDVKPHAYDPYVNPEFFEGVLARRMIAFLIDVVIITIPVILACMFIFLFGFVTFGLGWGLFFLVYPGAVVWALIYYGTTTGGPASATLGMRAVDIEIRTWYGSPCYFLLGVVHAIAFWVLISSLTPLVLLVGLFNERRRLLHDLLLGTVVINSERRAAGLRRYGRPGGANGL
jgi:uncharacterized RDD family membrane protein YckC